MLIILNNLDSHYEIEQLTRMFTKDISVVHGTKEDNDIPLTDWLYASKEDSVTVQLSYGGKLYTENLAADADTEKMYLDICAVVYNLYTTAFGKTLKWGMLTGVRPVRRMRNLYAKYKDIEVVCDLFKNRYFFGGKQLC